jgi:hypothetical protein
MEAIIAKLKKKPPLWITRKSVIMELGELTNDYISQFFSGSSRDFVYDDLRKNKDCYQEYLTRSPFWRLSMWNRTWDGENVKFNELNEKVRCDYYNALYECNMLYSAQISILNEFLKKNELDTKNNLLTAIKHEIILGLHGKICDNMLNEILSFC